MRSVKKLALALLVSGLTVSSALAQSDSSWGTAPAAPGLLPLPEISSSWANGDGYAGGPYAGGNYAGGNYASLAPAIDPSGGQPMATMAGYQPNPGMPVVR